MRSPRIVLGQTRTAMKQILLPVLLCAALLASGQETSKLNKVDIDYMMRGYFYASSKGPSELNGLGGWGGSSNGARSFTPPAGGSGLRILVDTTAVVAVDGKFRGQRVVVRNNGPDTLYFPAQDSRLYMKTQALRADSFADIEYLPSSWCGNSYHTLFLAPGEQWEFIMPRYEGARTTRSRIELTYNTTSDERKKARVAYSHTFPIGVNEEQFSNKVEYCRGGLMDPYED